jgi:hypothetical protein
LASKARTKDFCYGGANSTRADQADSLGPKVESNQPSKEKFPSRTWR